MNEVQNFWYLIATILGSILVWVITRYISKTEKLLEELTKQISELKTTTAIHSDKIQTIEKRIKIK